VAVGRSSEMYCLPRAVGRVSGAVGRHGRVQLAQSGGRAGGGAGGNLGRIIKHLYLSSNPF